MGTENRKGQSRGILKGGQHLVKKERKKERDV